MNLDVQFCDGQVHSEDALPEDMQRPLGLTGQFTVRGLLEHCSDGGTGLKTVEAPFRMTLTPNDTMLSVLCEAARVHQETFGEGDHTFVESFDVNAGERVIELGMGS